MYRLYVKSLWRETLENHLISDCVLSKDKLCNAFFCAFYINVCNLDNLEKLVYNQNDIKMVLGANTPDPAVVLTERGTASVSFLWSLMPGRKSWHFMFLETWETSHISILKKHFINIVHAEKCWYLVCRNVRCQHLFQVIRLLKKSQQTLFFFYVVRI